MFLNQLCETRQNGPAKNHNRRRHTSEICLRSATSPLGRSPIWRAARSIRVWLDQRLNHCLQLDSVDDGEPIKELYANETSHIRLLFSDIRSSMRSRITQIAEPKTEVSFFRSAGGLGPYTILRLTRGRESIGLGRLSFLPDGDTRPGGGQ
jgi:hypothetical protein